MVGIPQPSDLYSTDSGEQSVVFQQAMVPANLFRTGFELAVFSGAIKPAIKEMYSIALIDISKGIGKMAIVQGIEDPHMAGGTNEDRSGEFYFSVPPKVVEMGEPYATKVVSTQNGGKYVESHGSIIRELRIQGNSGLRPNKTLPNSVNLLGGAPLGPLAGPVKSIAGPIIDRGFAVANSITNVVQAIGLSEPNRGLDPSERTGYDDIMKLRNIFRAYSDIKNSAGAPNIVMVWRDIKTADYWIVEPKEFKLIQDSKSPLTYNYQIGLRTLARFEFSKVFSPDPLKGLKAGAKQIATIQRALREISTTLLVVSGSIDRLAAAGVFAQNVLVEPSINVIRGTSAIINSARGIQPSVANNWQRLNNNYQEALDTLEEQLFPNVPAVGSNVGITEPTDEEQERADSYTEIINAIRAGQRAARNVLIQPAMQDSLGARVSSRQISTTNAFRKFIPGGAAGGTLPTTVGDTSFIGNQKMSGNISSDVVGSGETIFSLAQRLLGNRNRWKLLVLINDLRAPYISNSGEAQTLAPGDYIYYPVQDGSGLSSADIDPTGAGSTETEQSGQNPDSVIDRAYGRDIRLKSDAKNRTDIVINASGDLASIQGVANVKQGIRLKFSTEQGTLTVHPKYGASFPIGTKMTQTSFNLFRLNTYATLISDPRIDRVKSLEFFARGDTLSLGAELILKNRSEVTTTSFEIAS